jgi:Cyclic nucleotide-binding domain/Pyridoxamine 5'-phosphate oxidase
VVGAQGLPDDVLQELRRQRVLTLATSSPTAVPRATQVAFVNDDASFFVRLAPGSAAARHVDENPVVAVAVAAVEGTGACRRVADGDRSAAETLFADKYGAAEAAGDLYRVETTALWLVSQAGDPTLESEHGREAVYDIFRTLSPGEVTTVAAALERVEAEPGTVVVSQGDRGGRFYVVVDGELEVVRETSGGGAQQVGTLGPGRFFGEMAILRDAPRSATVRAVTRTTLLAMDPELFRDLVARSLALTEDFRKLVSDRIYGDVVGPSE